METLIEQKDKYIHRLESDANNNRIPGYQVRIKKKNNKEISRFFNDSIYGGKEAALIEAIKFRDDLINKKDVAPPINIGSNSNRFLELYKLSKIKENIQNRMCKLKKEITEVTERMNSIMLDVGPNKKSKDVPISEYEINKIKQNIAAFLKDSEHTIAEIIAEVQSPYDKVWYVLSSKSDNLFERVGDKYKLKAVPFE